MRRLRRGEWTAAAAAAGLVVLLCLDPRAFGWPVLVLVLLAVASAVALLVTAAGRSVVGSVAGAVVAAVTTTVAALAVVVRVLVADQGAVAWLGLAAAIVLTVGAWWALADERTDAPQSAYDAPPARPAPPARAADAGPDAPQEGGSAARSTAGGRRRDSQDAGPDAPRR
ncbi:MAG: hypothetical protein QOC78_31 [Solirubrobacteraceae bacterium]|nr:hypothetical protein [Solirubrobacteraceae bacterium]